MHIHTDISIVETVIHINAAAHTQNTNKNTKTHTHVQLCSILLGSKLIVV